MVQPSPANNISRKQLLERLLVLREDPGKIMERLRSFPRDGIEEVTLTGGHIRSVLERFKKGELSAREVEDWANMIEGREDIAYDKNQIITIKQMVFDLANPVLSGNLTPGKGQGLLLQLDNLDGSKDHA